AVTDVERDHARRATLEEDVSEAAGRSAHVGAVEVGRIDAEPVESVCELLAAARDVRRRTVDRELCVLLHLLTRLVEAVDEAGENERLGLRPRLGEPALHEEDVEALLHARYSLRPRSQSTSGSHPSMTSP